MALRFCFPNLFIGVDSQTPQRTTDADQLALMFASDAAMDAHLDNVDVYGFYPTFASKHTTASDALIARAIPILAGRGIKVAIHPAGPYGYSVPYTSGVITPTPEEMGIASATQDLTATGYIGYLQSLGLPIDWIIMDSPIDRVTDNGLSEAAHRAFRGFGVTGDNTFVRYTAVTAGAAGNSQTVAHVVSGLNTPLSVTASTVSPLSDTFTRTESNTWGNAETGAAWSLTGTAADFDVAGTTGTIAVTAAGQTKIAANAMSASTANVQ